MSHWFEKQKIFHSLKCYTSIIAWVLLHLFTLEHFSSGTVNEYERDGICVDSTGLLYKSPQVSFSS